ncbi:hypothetical protein SIN01_10490 [Sporolactobacillus inulinus]|nr:hypothetical protein SIN01_10490 [Sporolactobacillus inulinus]
MPRSTPIETATRSNRYSFSTNTNFPSFGASESNFAVKGCWIMVEKRDTMTIVLNKEIAVAINLTRTPEIRVA